MYLLKNKARFHNVDPVDYYSSPWYQQCGDHVIEIGGVFCEKFDRVRMLLGFKNKIEEVFLIICLILLAPVAILIHPIMIKFHMRSAIRARVTDAMTGIETNITDCPTYFINWRKWKNTEKPYRWNGDMPDDYGRNE